VRLVYHGKLLLFYMLNPLQALCGEDVITSFSDIGLYCRYMGTITGMGDLDPARWPNSHWRSLKVLSIFQIVVNG
jgi:hypothetical protein